MNWLYIAVMAYIVISALRGFHTGFLKAVYSMAALLLMAVFVTWATPRISHMLRLYTPLYERTLSASEKYIERQSGEYEEIVELLHIPQTAAAALANVCIGAVGFLISLLLISFLLMRIAKRLDLFEKTPGIHIIDKISGFFAGIVRAFFGIWIMFILIKASAILPTSTACIKLIKSSAVLTELYERNRLWELIQNLI